MSGGSRSTGGTSLVGRSLSEVYIPRSRALLKQEGNTGDADGEWPEKQSTQKSGRQEAWRGRPRGSLNKASVDFERLLAEKSESITAIVPGAFEGNSHALLMSIYKDPTMPIATRMDAAKASLPYEKPRFRPSR